MDPNRFVQGTYIHPPDPNAFLFMDASHYGWGAHLKLMRLSFHGYWREDQSQLHINILEKMAIHFALKMAIQYIHYLLAHLELCFRSAYAMACCPFSVRHPLLAFHICDISSRTISWIEQKLSERHCGDIEIQNC